MVQRKYGQSPARYQKWYQAETRVCIIYASFLLEAETNLSLSLLTVQDLAKSWTPTIWRNKLRQKNLRQLAEILRRRIAKNSLTH